MQPHRLDQHLIEAAEKGNLSQVKLQLTLGANPNADNSKALQLASENGHLKVVQLLLDCGANVHAYNENSLARAVGNNHQEIVRLLINKGADPFLRGGYNLMMAVMHDNYEVVRLLLNHGANPHEYGNTAIIDAYVSGKIDIVNLLLPWYKPQNDNAAFTTMIIINNYRLTRQYYKYSSEIISTIHAIGKETTRQISKYIIRNITFDDPDFTIVIYSKNYHIHGIKVPDPDNKLKKTI